MYDLSADFSIFPLLYFHSYDKGGHLFLPSYVMRTHGVRQQREAVKRAPRKQLEPVFEVWVCYRRQCHACWVHFTTVQILVLLNEE